VAAQLDVFNTLVAPYRMARSLANSAALLRFPSNPCRLGAPWHHAVWCIAVRGSQRATTRLAAVMTLQSRIIAVQELRAGETIGYGGLFRAEAPMRVGVVACGYATAIRATRQLARQCWWTIIARASWGASRWTC